MLRSVGTTCVQQASAVARASILRRFAHSTSASVDSEEIRKFSAISAEWWDTDGKFRALHALNPARLQFIRRCAVDNFGADMKSPLPLEGVRVLDLGCGGGLVTESLARLGASVLGVDASSDNIQIAQAHASLDPRLTTLTYECTTGEALVEQGELFDMVCSLEVVEHTADPRGFVRTCCDLVEPGGLLCMSTLNRTPEALLFGKIAAEYVLRWADPGTHDWGRFIRPEELSAMIKSGGMDMDIVRGVVFDPLRNSWSISQDVSINYIVSALKPMGDE